MPGDLKARAPARNHAEESRPRVARHELGAKMMDFAPADLSNPDPRLVLRKRLREEMEALRGILKKAELLAGKTVGDGRVAPCRGKDRRFLAAEGGPAAMDADRPSSAKRRKMMPLEAAVKPRMSEDEISNLTTKRRKTMPLAVVVNNVKPRMSADEISNLVTRMSLLSEDMPARILEFLKKECTGHEDGNSGEMVIDIGSMRHSALFELRKLLDEFAEEEKLRRQKEASANASKSTSCSSPHEHEDGEIAEEGNYDVATDTCSYASPVAAGKVLRSPPRTLEDSEEAKEEVICGGAAPVATEQCTETGNSPSSSSSSSSSGSSSSSSSSSGGSRSDSSDSDSSDSDSDDESVTSRPTPAVLPKTDDLSKQPQPVAVVLCSSKCLTEQDTRSNPRSSSSNFSSLLEDGEIEEECSVTPSPPAPEKFAETVISPAGSSKSSGSAGDGSVCSIGIAQQQQPAARDRKTPISEAEYRDMIAKARQKQRRQCNPERKRAYEELEEKERSATPISDWIHPMQLKQLGITPVEHAVTSERRIPGRRSPVQKLLGLFLKAE